MPQHPSPPPPNAAKNPTRSLRISSNTWTNILPTPHPPPSRKNHHHQNSSLQGFVSLAAVSTQSHPDQQRHRPTLLYSPPTPPCLQLPANSAVRRQNIRERGETRQVERTKKPRSAAARHGQSGPRKFRRNSNKSEPTNQATNQPKHETSTMQSRRSNETP